MFLGIRLFSVYLLLKCILSLSESRINPSCQCWIEENSGTLSANATADLNRALMCEFKYVTQ